MKQQESGGEGEGGQDQAGRRDEGSQPDREWRRSLNLVNNSTANILIRFLSQSYLINVSMNQTES